MLLHLKSIGWMSIFAKPKSEHANKIWLSIGSYLKVGILIFVTKTMANC